MSRREISATVIPETDARFPTLARVFTDRIFDHLSKTPDNSQRILVLDVGAYRGTLTEMIQTAVNQRLKEKGRRQTIEIIRLDPIYNRSEDVRTKLLVGKEQGRNYVAAKGESLPLADGSVPIIMAADVIHHSERPFGVIEEMYRVLQPNGLMIIKDHDPNNALRFMESAVADVMGNTANFKEQIRQFGRIIREVLKKNGVSSLQAKPNKPGDQTPSQSPLTLVGGNVGDVGMTFNYLSAKQWQEIAAELGKQGAQAYPQPRFIYDYIPRFLRKLGLGRIEQNNILWIMEKPGRIPA